VRVAKRLAVVCLFLSSYALGSASAATLDSKALAAISAATFEVVVPKPSKDPLTYERPLPMDLIPYAIRKDKYYSVGTAFAIAPDRFVSAAHVFNLGAATQYEGVYLRDHDGNVYSIDKILKYSDRKDFVVFSVKGKTATAVLSMETKPQLNEQVYTVGNALGQGIVIRDGLYTSNTPEEQDGEWNWMRFSAAASPGNSGGPLLDEKGHVLGIVLRKSGNENLNYALPIAELIKAKDNVAVVDKKLMYRLDNMDMTKTDTLKQQIALPKPFDELNRMLIRTTNDFGDSLLKALFEENRDAIFPKGPGSVRMLHTTYSAIFPNLIAKSDDGNWDGFAPDKTNDADLGANGYLKSGTLGSSLLLRVRKPDNVSLDRLYGDSKLFMDLVLKGVPITRTIGSEKIKITSLGKAEDEYVYTDAYQRKWLVRVWAMPFSDEKVVAFVLPAPGGSVAMLRASDTSVINGHIADLKALTNFVYLSYYGTFEQWREFLAAKDYLPAALSSVKIAFDYGRRFSYESKRIAFAYDPSLLKITKKSDLQLKMSYFVDNGKVVWDVAGLVVGDDKDTGTFVDVTRNIQPAKGMSDKDRSDWEKIIHAQMPYNRTSFFNDKTTVIGAVYTQDIVPAKLAAAPVLYSVVYGVDGNFPQQTVEPKLKNALEHLKVYER
jgi:serine protease Do